MAKYAVVHDLSIGLPQTPYNSRLIIGFKSIIGLVLDTEMCFDAALG